MKDKKNKTTVPCFPDTSYVTLKYIWIKDKITRSREAYAVHAFM